MKMIFIDINYKKFLQHIKNNHICELEYENKNYVFNCYMRCGFYYVSVRESSTGEFYSVRLNPGPTYMKIIDDKTWYAVPYMEAFFDLFGIPGSVYMYNLGLNDNNSTLKILTKNKRYDRNINKIIFSFLI